MTAIDLSADIGLAAVFTLTANLLMGLLLGAKYNPWTHWPHKRFNYFRLHNWTGYIALTLTLLHPVVLLSSEDAKFRLIDIVYPVNAPKQPWINVLGAIALYTLLVVVVTSYFRRTMNRKRWKAIHFAAYGAAFFAFIHSIWTDPTLKDAAIDYLDGEKVAVELCPLIALVATVWRIRHGRHQATIARRDHPTVHPAA
ncbi:MAG TPA: ferric reductase-like transmembrane domain-containing protein [Gemmatimonadales bacterium]